MGTNYYWVLPPRHDSEDIEKRGLSLHICKLSGGWLPLFQGYPHGIAYDQDYVEEFPLVKEVVSVADWKQLFAGDPEGHIEDEYGETHSQEEFWKRIEGWRRQKNPIKHLEYMSKNHPSFLSDYWVDREGYEFDKRDFS